MRVTLRREGLPFIFFRALLPPDPSRILPPGRIPPPSSLEQIAGTLVNNSFVNLTRFFDAFISLSFWQRIFGWKSVRSLSYPAYDEARELFEDLTTATSSLQKVDQELKSVRAELEQLRTIRTTMETELRSTIARQTADITQLNDRIERLNRANSALEKEQAALKQDETSRRIGYEKSVATLEAIQQRVLQERKAEQDERERSKLQRLQEMKERWSRHQKDVESIIRSLCRRHTIEYVEAVPFRGNPDNTVRIADEYVVFDAKSPAGDDLKNFPSYIKAQNEAVRKYANQDGVRKEIFLVIPADTAEVLGQHTYNLADYTVYVVTPNALEPILLALKKLEDYEFVNQLSPDERENICRLLGKFAHVVKRRIQVDHFFAWEFLDVLTKCESGLPREFIDRMVEYEKSEKLNPPQERRSKQILTKDLEEDTKKIERETAARVVEIPPSLDSSSAGLPLFEKREQ
jgi:hypothetical protein